MNTNTIEAVRLKPLANMTTEAVDELMGEARFSSELVLRTDLDMFTLCEAAIIRVSCSLGVLCSLEGSQSVDQTDRDTVSAARMLLEEAQAMIHAVRKGVADCKALARSAKTGDT